MGLNICCNCWRRYHHYWRLNIKTRCDCSNSDADKLKIFHSELPKQSFIHSILLSWGQFDFFDRDISLRSLIAKLVNVIYRAVFFFFFFFFFFFSCKT